MRHARLLVEFYDGDERMAVHDLRKHIAWYLKGFPVGGTTRRAFMECENLADVERETSRLDPAITFPERVKDKPRTVFALQKSASAVRLARLSGHHARGARDAVRRRSDGRRILRRHPGHGPNAAMVCRFVQMRWKNVDTRRENSFIINGSAIELCVTVSDRRQW